MRDRSNLTIYLRQLGLTEDEANIFMCLLEGPKSLLEVSRLTGIARSNVYRIIDELMQQSIVHELTTESGRLVASVQPEALELLVIEQERIAESKRANFRQILPLLNQIRGRDTIFATKTYGGIGGLKQMLWNELRSKEILIFSCGSLDLITGKRWAEKYRQEIIDRRIFQRSIENTRPAAPISNHAQYPDHYAVRYIPHETLAIHHELTIHDDTISLYNSWTDHTQLGTEIKNPFLATFMRQIFEHYWSIAKE